jgi:hypothetical protein
MPGAKAFTAAAIAADMTEAGPWQVPGTQLSQRGQGGAGSGVRHGPVTGSMKWPQVACMCPCVQRAGAQGPQHTERRTMVTSGRSLTTVVTGWGLERKAMVLVFSTTYALHVRHNCHMF